MLFNTYGGGFCNSFTLVFRARTSCCFKGAIVCRKIVKTAFSSKYETRFPWYMTFRLVANCEIYDDMIEVVPGGDGVSSISFKEFFSSEYNEVSIVVDDDDGAEDEDEEDAIEIVSLEELAKVSRCDR
jgi:hypothetical protein